MAAASSKQLGDDPLLRLKLVCEDLNADCVIYENEANGIRFPTSEGAMEINLDIDELYSLYYMCTWPMIKLMLSNLIACFRAVHKDSFQIDRDTLLGNRKWSDIVADRFPNLIETSQAAPQPIDTIITS
jgi:hypothetical protein